MPNLKRLGDRRVRMTLGLVTFGVCVLAPTGYTVHQIQALQEQNRQQGKAVSALATNLAGAQQQLKEHGIAPSQPPPSQIIAQVGPPGATGAQGPSGQSGPSGPSGPPGAVGPTGPSGAAGAPGSPGPAGPSGTSGNDGAQGSQGPSGPPGPTGPSGPSGAPGPSGPAGPSGPPGPAPSEIVIVGKGPLGPTQTCTPDPAPHYTCS